VHNTFSFSLSLGSDKVSRFHTSRSGSRVEAQGDEDVQKTFYSSVHTKVVSGLVHNTEFIVAVVVVVVVKKLIQL